MKHIKLFEQFINENASPVRNEVKKLIAKSSVPELFGVINWNKDDKSGYVSAMDDVEEILAAVKSKYPKTRVENKPEGKLVIFETVESEDFTFIDAVETAGEKTSRELRGCKDALAEIGATKGNDAIILTDTTEPDGEDLFDEIEKMEPISVNSNIYDEAYAGKYKGRNVVVFRSDGELYAYVKK
jgi:hypothetical protein